MKKELFIKYLNDECTEAEHHEILEFLETAVVDNELRKWSFEVWDSWRESNEIQNVDFSTIFENIQKEIDIKHSKYQKASRGKLVLSWITRIAAALLIPVLSLLFYTISENKTEIAKYANYIPDSIEVITQPGSKTIVQLTDGTEVHLNNGSRIKYPRIFLGDTRDVEFSGEAFFKVAHNPDKPFVVKTDKLNVKAVGTTFNVLAYPNDKVVSTTLLSGKVVLEQLDNCMSESKELITLKPGQHVDFNTQSGEMSEIDEDIEKYTAWTEGKLIFEDTPILEMTESLSRIFNVDFEISDDIKDYTYTVTFTEETLYQILDLMTLATPISYEKCLRKELPDGSYSKQKIILRKHE
ncbi:MAG: FecR family protein [Bacteroidales bacterium]